MRFSRYRDEIWSHLHVHSLYSATDALSSVPTLVARAKANGQPALGLTDHGNMSGAVTLYQECMKAGLLPFPGSEMYLVRDRADKKAKRHHLGVLATSGQGYRNLVALSSLSHRNFYHKPLLDLSDLAEASEAGRLRGLVALSGCYSGLPIQDLLNYGPEQAKTTLACYAGWFDQCYVELMDHGIVWDDGSTDADLCLALAQLADELGLPVLVTADSHYAFAEQRVLHESLKRLVSYGSGDDDGVFRGSGYDLSQTSVVKRRHTAKNWISGLAGQADLQARWDLSIPELDKYHYNIPVIIPDPMRELRKRVGTDEVVAEELDVIERTGMASYLCWSPRSPITCASAASSSRPAARPPAACAATGWGSPRWTRSSGSCATNGSSPPTGPSRRTSTWMWSTPVAARCWTGFGSASRCTRSAPTPRCR